jgi:hypothetical protein
MAYQGAIFYIDLVNGSDAARTALTSCTASNPSGTITRINKTGHGLVTGAVVDLTLFSAWLNSAFKITIVDADNFDLDDTVWQATADASGTVTPRGGSSWSDAWQFPVTGPTAARTQPGDTIRIAKSPDPVSLGQSATFTEDSQDVVLTTALTKNIEDAITGWTASTNVTASTSTQRKFGATSVNLAIAAGFTTGKVAYQTVDGGGTQNFSGYEKVSFWFFTSAALAANVFSIKLCSDATGDTPVETLDIPACPIANAWYPIVIDKGSALSASVQSVALYTNSDPGAISVRLNNIVGANDLTHKVLIGKSTDAYHPIQSIDDTTIKIDSNSTSASGRGYSGSTNTETIYIQTCYDITPASFVWTIPEGGTSSGGHIEYSGGWDTGSTVQNGRTWIDTLCTGGALFSSSQNYLKFTKLGIVRATQGFSLGDTAGHIIEDCVLSNFSTGILGTTSIAPFLIKDCVFTNNSSTFLFPPDCYGIIDNCTFQASAFFGIQCSGGMSFYDCLFRNNGIADVAIVESAGYGTGAVLLRRCQLLSSTEFSVNSNKNGYVWSFDHNNTTGNNVGRASDATIDWQTGTVHASEPGAWKITCTHQNRNANFPVVLPLGPFGVNAGSLVTFKVWIKKDHATNISARIRVDGYSLTGVSETTTTKADDTSWEELTITFTPTQKGAIMIFVDVWCTSPTSANVYVGTATLTQA